VIGLPPHMCEGIPLILWDAEVWAGLSACPHRSRLSHAGGDESGQPRGGPNRDTQSPLPAKEMCGKPVRRHAVRRLNIANRLDIHVHL